jgi:two-component system, OmpR family, sensor histidine kinase KdpD
MTANRAESFLRLIRRSQRGRLKLYLGYVAGVGKTYQMLLEAHRLEKDGIDVAAGVVETHGRAETEALLEGLEVIPRRKSSYRGIEIEEMDLEAILRRRPEVVLVDELAHTNVPGGKNAKRYQDVEEILSAGIHVISTLNVQHLESLFDTIERATGVKVRERIPDRIIVEADQIVNVDITTEDLRQRLNEGKVYTKERIQVAMDHFFRPANLEQLRELALRELAAQIDSRRRDPLSEDVASSPDQVMVCMSSRGPNSEALLRYASRLAGRLNRNWYAVYVQTSREHPKVIDSATQRILSNTLTLAQELGATVFTYRGDDIVKTLLQFAREYRVGHIVIGTPGKKVPFWRRLRGEVSIIERLITTARDITVVVVDTKAIPEEHLTTEGIRSAGKSPRSVWDKAGLSAGESAALFKSGVIIWDRSLEKEEAIRQLLDLCCREQKELWQLAWEALLERENQGGTFVGEEVAIPHARLTGLHHSLVGIGVCKSGIMDDTSGHTVRIMIVMLSPTEPPENHVAMLGVVSRMALDDMWRKEVTAAGRPADAAGAIHKWMEQYKTDVPAL